MVRTALLPFCLDTFSTSLLDVSDRRSAATDHIRGSRSIEEELMGTLAKKLAVLIALTVLVLMPEPPAAAGKLSLWRLKTYIPPADKILDTNAQECAKKAGLELAIQTYTFDDMWTKFTAAIESKTLPDIAELDAVGPARLANLGRLADVSD